MCLEEGRKEEIDSENYKCCTNVFVLWFVFQEVEQPCFCHSSTSVYYTKCKLKNKNGEGLRMRLSTIYSCACSGFVEMVGLYQPCVLPAGPRR